MGPLAGIRVVELSTGVAGPIAGMLLGDYGAEVVKVEPPGGDLARAMAGFAVWNRNKQSIVLDPCAEADRRRLAAMLAAADVCIAPSADGPASARVTAAANPALVFLHAPPYLPSGAPWAGGGESDGLLQAIAGPSSRQSSFGGGPVHLVYPFPLYLQGYWGAACTVAALVERERSGLGQVVTVAGIHGALAASPASFVVDPSQPPLPTDVGAGGRHPCYTTYRCRDGKWLFLAALTPKFQANAFRVLGVGDLFADPRLDGVPNRMLLPENRGWVRQTLADAFATRDRDDWLARLEEGDCPAGPMGDRDAWLDHPQVHANGLRVELDDPERGRVTMPGLCLALSNSPGCVRTPAPRLGEHQDTAGRGWTPRARSAATGAADRAGPLAGVRVLDLGAILAGPYAGALLAELGADVVKVEPPAGDAFRETGFVYNRGMRGLSIDLSKEAGQVAFHRLARTADVVIDNSRHGVARRLKADYDTLRAHNPRIVCLSVAGFGEHGPFAHKPAFDPVLQAMSGIMSAQGNDDDPVLFTIPINDVCAAVTSVLGVALGLFHRARTGEGQRVVTSLVASSLSMQAAEIVRFAGRPPAIKGGRDFLGPTPADRFYRVADGWVRVQAPSVAALEEALGVPPSRGSRPHRPAEDGREPDERIPAADSSAVLAEAFAGMALDVALQALRARGIPVAPARHPADIVRDPDVAAVALVGEHRFPDGQPFYMPERYARFSRTEQRTVRFSPGVGEHSREVLAEAGLDDAEIDRLVEDKVVKQGEPFVLKGLVNYR